MARTANVGNGLALTLPDDSSITYNLVGTELRRTAGESQMTLARNISAVEFLVEESEERIIIDSFFEDRKERVVIMTVTSSPEGRPNISENRTYRVCLRPTEPAHAEWRAQ